MHVPNKHMHVRQHRLWRCYSSNNQVLSALQVVTECHSREKRGLGFSSLRPQRARSGITITSISSLCVLEKISLFTSVGYNVTAH